MSKKEKKTKEDKTSKNGKDLHLELQKEIMVLKDKLMRNLAEFDNFRKRSAIEREAWIKHATSRLVLKICDVVDNMQRAIATGAKKHQFESFMKGINQIYAQLQKVLEGEGVTQISPLGEDFNPEFHEALSTVESDDEEGKIIGVIQNGYLQKDKLIRPAMVSVSSGRPNKSKGKKEKK